MELIKETLINVFKDLEKKNKSGFSEGLENIFKKVLAKKAIKHVKLYNFRNGVLSIKVDSSSWLYYLNLQKAALLVKFQKETDLVKDIRFSLGDM